MTRRSTSRRAFQAATTPIGMASASAMARVEIASAAVGSSRWLIRRVTGRLEKIETPRSPCTRPHSQTANCSTTGRSSPSLARTAAIDSAVASSPAMMAAGSPGASRSRKNTNTATTAITGMVASKRRRIYAVIRRAIPPLLLADVPQHDQPGVRHDSVDAVGAIGERRRPLAERNVDHLFDRARLQVAGDLLALLVGLRKTVGVAQLLDLGIARPAEQSLVAGRTDPGMQDRMRAADAARGGHEDVPAALRRRLLLGPTRDHRAPVHRLGVDVDAGLPHGLDQHLRCRCDGGMVGCGQNRDRLALIAGLLEELERLLRIVVLQHRAAAVVL